MTKAERGAALRVRAKARMAIGGSLEVLRGYPPGFEAAVLCSMLKAALRFDEAPPYLKLRAELVDIIAAIEAGSDVQV